jgi:uncharacterized protein (TIGR04141 family)
MFAFPFGSAGRFMLRNDVYARGYGMRTALNLLYPRGGDEAGRLRAVDSKRRSTTILRSRFQVSEPSNFETFDDVNRQSDTVLRAVGIPADADAWGRNIGGSDALTLNIAIQFDEIGELCRRIEAAHGQDDYRDLFDWIDYVQPISDPALVDRLENEIEARLRSRQIDGLVLAPPEIVDWDVASAFRFHYDRKQGVAQSAVTHPDLRLADYLSGLAARDALHDLDCSKLRTRHIDVLDGSGNQLYRWSIWRCLVGELRIDGATYILDEGDLFEVRNDYLQHLDDFIRAIPSSDIALPDTSPMQSEGDYNAMAAAGSDELLLLDRRTVRISNRTTAIEICDLLSRDRQLVHVKRHLGSSNLSHLFAQGLVSAELLQSSPEFRRCAADAVSEFSDNPDAFDFFAEEGIIPSYFEVVFAIAERWDGRNPDQALPFFSKVNLREAATNLRERGYKVALNRIEAVV